MLKNVALYCTGDSQVYAQGGADPGSVFAQQLMNLISKMCSGV